MKKNFTLFLAIALFLSACSLATEEEIKQTRLPDSTQNTTEEIGDSMVEDWPEDTTAQSTAGTEGPTQPVSPETKPGIETEQTKPSEPTTPSESAKPDDTHKQMTFAEYLALDAAGRQAYVESFPSMEEAMLWYESAKKAYDESQDNIDISGGNIDLGNIIESMGK